MKAPCLIAFALGCMIAGAAAAERRDHDAHVHGSAEMDIAALGSELEISLRSPAMNIVGFEHEPRTDEQHQRFREALDVLRDGERLFVFDGGPCRLDESEVQRDHGEAEHEHAEHDHAEHDHGEEAHGEEEHEHAEAGDVPAHSDIRARYSFRCDGGIDMIEIGLFDEFPRTEEIRVQYLTGDSQGAATLTPDAPVLRLE